MSERTRWSRRDWLTMAGSALVVILLAALVGGVLAFVGSGSSASAVTLEPAAQSGVDPFTASVQIGPAVSLPSSVQAVTAVARKTYASDPKTHTLVAPTTAPGLYGGSGDVHVCNPNQLVTFLGEHPGKAAAWAGVLGISVNDIGNYVTALTPVVLTSDTLVTNHGYHDGRATTLTSVLQAGTAVMVDSYGVPRVKCNCGNPLTSPELVNPTHYRGMAWPDYAPTQVTVVHSSTQITNLTVINIRTGDTYTERVGAVGGEFVASSGASIFTSADGTTWTKTTSIPDYASGVVSAADKLLAVADSAGQTVVWSVGNGGSTHIAILPGTSSDIDYGGGRWVLSTVQSTPSGYGAGSIYTSTDASNWTKADVTVRTADYGSGSGNRVPVAYGNGMWLAVGSQPSDMYTSRDGLHWVLNGSHADYGYGLALGFGAGEWVLGTDAGTITSHDTVSWTPASHAGLRDRKIGAVAYGNGKWLATGYPGDPVSNLKPTLFSSTDATSWTPAEQTFVPDALTFGGAPSTAGGVSSPSTPTTTAPPQTATTTTTKPSSSVSSLSGIDWRNYTYKDLACGTDKLVKFTNGAWVPPSNGPASCYGMSFVAVDFADVTGDGVPDAIVNLQGHASGVLEGESSWTTVFTASPSGPVNHGYVYGVSFPPYSAGITTWTPHLVGSDPNCCPSQFQKDAYTYSNGKFTKSGTTYVPANQLPKR